MCPPVPLGNPVAVTQELSRARDQRARPQLESCSNNKDEP